MDMPMVTVWSIISSIISLVFIGFLIYLCCRYCGNQRQEAVGVVGPGGQIVQQPYPYSVTPGTPGQMYSGQPYNPQQFQQNTQYPPPGQQYSQPPPQYTPGQMPAASASATAPEPEPVQP